MTASAPEITLKNDADLGALLARIDERLARVEGALETFESRVDALGELKEDLMPMANGIFAQASEKLTQLDDAGALEFAREGTALLERVATAFTAEDVRLLGENLIGILGTVRNLTQPEVLSLADRATSAVMEAERHPPEKVKLLRSMRDPEVRRGMGVMLAVLKELGQEGSSLGATAPTTPEQR